MTLNVDEFRKYLQVDKSALDDELIQQPTLFFRVAEAVIEAASVRDALKEELAVIDAELDGQARRNREGEKYTEAVIKNAVQTSKKHEVAFEAYMAAKTAADTFAALREAFSQRQYMLKELCSLHTTEYFQTTSFQGNDATDKAIYKRQRERLADARDRKRG